MNETHNCPFFGRHFVATGKPFTLIESHGNQCALFTSGYAPCSLELAGEYPNWKACPRVSAITHDLSPQHESDQERARR